MNTNFFSPRMGKVEKIHFVGIGGSGMCGIAEVLHNEGYKVSGSDISKSRSVEHLEQLGIDVNIGHTESNVENVDVVVRSTAIEDNNVEILAACKKNIPVIPRATMLAELMRFRYGIAVGGTHGKTTTTSIVSSLLAEGGLDPSFVIGGKLTSCGSNAQLGKSRYFVAEADESDASFLFLKPMLAIVTNIDADHMGTYDDNFDKLRNTFLEFLHHLPFYGSAIVCMEDDQIKSIIPQIQRRTLTYGFSQEADYYAYDWSQSGLKSEFKVVRPKPHKELLIKFNWPGRHNVLNALASIAVATELDVDDASIKRGLLNFQGVGRRFQMLGERQFQRGEALIVDDYGHHPQEIISTIDAFRKVWPQKKLIHVFQPHRYTRTKALFSQFVHALSLADELILLDVYPAGEDYIEGFGSHDLAKQITLPNVKVINAENLEKTLNEIVDVGDVILMQGAGNIGQLAQKIAQNLRESE